jgi:hypothetical protein
VSVGHHIRDDAGRGGGHEGFLGPGRRGGTGEIADIGLHIGIPAPGERPETIAALHAAPWKLAGPLGKTLPVGEDARFVVLAAEAGDTVGHVGGEARLAHLAVADHINARPRLFTDHLVHRRLDAGGEGSRIYRLPRLARLDHRE